MEVHCCRELARQSLHLIMVIKSTVMTETQVLTSKNDSRTNTYLMPLCVLDTITFGWANNKFAAPKVNRTIMHLFVELIM